MRITFLRDGKEVQPDGKESRGTVECGHNHLCRWIRVTVPEKPTLIQKLFGQTEEKKSTFLIVR